ncbi:DUF2867 domain-containing protein [Rhizobium sp. CFBP 8762]|uniref:DUF2867 domain-containing protein n=1 Tax=Rhizobium sp. CFBP 8762 TaxID=2775279 RepID=UPI00177ADE13|nr:DUF2867 domain-containing protein [Rhizobium sp. CFBP 8762]MBD8555502.1 DUF2867 domain-containing protein [Rhizobium sp. CFBP 8762]
MKPVQQPVTFPHPVLPGADWADSFVLPVCEKRAVREIADQLLEKTPLWMNSLMALRNGAVAPFGLKAVTMQVGGETGFPIVSMDADRAVLGFDDKHLNFRIVIDALQGPTGEFVSITTLVDRKTLAGRAYIAVVGPFHRKIVPILLKTLN